MPETIDNYVPQMVAVKTRRQAILVWSIFALISAIWVFLILLAPITADSSLGISHSLYSFFGYLCHQISERSFEIYGHAFAVCSRCFGVYFGLMIGFLIYPFLRQIEETEPLPRFWLFLAMIPIAIDWLLGVFEIWENTHLSRFVTGAILGAACAIFIIPALVDAFQILSNKYKVKRLSN